MVAILEQNSEVENVNPPYVKRGLDSQKTVTVGIHWLRASFDKSCYNSLLEFTSLFFGEYDEQKFGLWRYDRSINWPVGVSLNYQSSDERDEITKGKVTLEVQGKALDGLSFSDIEILLDGLRIFEPQVGRLDLYFDDVHRVISPAMLHRKVVRLSKDGKRVLKADFSGFRKCSRKDDMDATKGREFDTVTFGKRGSKGNGKFLRVYDKELESDGANNAIRWELELSGDKSNAVYKALCCNSGDVEKMAKVISSTIGGCIDFVHRTGDKNIGRLERYEFWDYILFLLGAAKIENKPVKKSIEKSKEWIERQVTKSLTAIKKAFGDREFFEWFLSLIETEQPLSAAHLNAIAEYKQTQESKGKAFEVAYIKDFFNERGLTFVY
ncbi:MAG TPA: hypothetical protein DDW84_08990 [Phycisphaerales bacterium]|nr:MAG: hypothetical protein A2Y13_04700 [Planctomycetes bacterium GWC2_45_44]HBG78954.1 hypothetical protein [Phycisphaerales bacterium]HBR19280.1 hypothetical protein [Phycisphaerales bacterium]